jgi:antitoxin component YwqK of YwqJK toxin-antitoxin module
MRSRSACKPLYWLIPVACLAAVIQLGCGQGDGSGSGKANPPILKFDVAYVNGQPRGLFTKWHANGQKAETGTIIGVDRNACVGPGYIYDGPRLEWYEDGKPKTRESYSKGVINGPRVEWYEKEKLKTRENYLNGTLNGRAEYWDNYDLGYWKRKNVHYKNGKLHGVHISWNTTIKIVTDYRDGKVHGRLCGYAVPGGELKYEYWYKNDQPSEPFDLVADEASEKSNVAVK